MKETEHARVAKAAGVVGMATMLSRIFGFVRDVVVAAFFGAAAATDAFFVAFRIPNLLRRLLGEGSLTVAFVPVFTEYLTRKTKAEAAELANVVFTILSIILVVVSLLGVLFSPLIVLIMAPGFSNLPYQFELAVFLTRLMFPYIFFISLVALCMGILNSLRHFRTGPVAGHFEYLHDYRNPSAPLVFRRTHHCTGHRRHGGRCSATGHAVALSGQDGDPVETQL